MLNKKLLDNMVLRAWQQPLKEYYGWDIAQAIMDGVDIGPYLEAMISSYGDETEED